MTQLKPTYDAASFYPLTAKESVSGTRPRHTKYQCGACGNAVTGRVLCELQRANDHKVLQWCLCSCERLEPQILELDGGQVISQCPNASEFHSKDSWPPDLAKLYDEGAKAYAAAAFTASSMVCRKILMNCACHEGADQDLKFFKYVDYIVENVLMIPRAKDSITAIKEIGNEANHEVQFVSQDGARRAMQIVTYLLDAIYSLPAA